LDVGYRTTPSVPFKLDNDIDDLMAIALDFTGIKAKAGLHDHEPELR
jgi:hypothetical protein